MPINHPANLGHLFEQFFGLPSHRLPPSVPVSEQHIGLFGIHSLVVAFRHQPHLVGDARHAPFQGRQVRPVLDPHPARPLQPVPLTGTGSAPSLPHLVSRLHNILTEMELVIHHPSVSEIIPDALQLGDAHVDGHSLNRFQMAIVHHQFRGKCLPN